MSLLPSGAIETGGYNINNSLRFRSSASAYLSRTPSVASNRKTWTWSGWVKRGSIGNINQGIFCGNPDWNDNSTYFGFSGDQIFFFNRLLTVANGNIYTTAVYRDPSAWYHIVVAMDTTQATAANRFKLYVNGNQVTSFAIETYPTQNTDMYINSTQQQILGFRRDTVSVYNYFDGYLAEVNFIDGQQLTPSSFGETNTTTGVWKPKAYTGTYGTNGFYLPFSSFITGGSLTSATVNGFSSYAYNESGADYVKTASTSAFNVGTGNFTLEAFIKFNTVDTWDFVLSYNSSNVQQQNMLYYYHPTGEISYYDQNTFANLTCAYTFTAGVWYHVALVRNSGTLRMYINGVVQPSTLGYTTNINTISYLQLASQTSRTSTKGQISNLRFNNTAVYTSNFTPSTSALTAISGTQLLTFQNSTLIDNSTNALALTNTATGNPSAIADNSGNGNYWNFNNMNLSTSTATTYDWMKDVPTLTSATVANYAVWNPLRAVYTGTLSNANLTAASGTSGNSDMQATISLPTSGQYYWEITLTNNGGNGYIGIKTTSGQTGTSQYGYYIGSGQKVTNTSGGNVAYGSSYTTNDVIGFTYDGSTGILVCYKNNVSQGTLQTFTTGQTMDISCDSANTGSGSVTYQLNCGQRGFTYTPPTGYVALNTYNLPTSTIVQGNKYMDATTYTGTGSATQTITNAAGFKPDFVWVKSRSAAFHHGLFDAVRGVGSGNTTDRLVSNATWAQDGGPYMQSLNSNGFTITNYNATYTENGTTYVGWQWQAGQGTTSSNTSGSITSTVSVNASAGFSVVTWTAVADNSTIGHGLGVTPAFIITKSRSNVINWVCYHKSLGANGYIQLNLTNAAGTASGFWGTPNSTTFGVSANGNANNSGNMVAYCWAEIAGFSKFGSYTGNGSTDGTFVYTGFRPKYVLIKRTDTGGFAWEVYDNARNLYNSDNNVLYPNLSDAEASYSSGQGIDSLSNGFKLRASGGGTNASGGTYIYAAFAENPFKNALAR